MEVDGEVNRYQNVQVGTLLILNTLIEMTKGDARSQKCSHY